MGFAFYIYTMKIELQKGQRLWFTSDTHYNHSNICRATTRWKDSDNVTRDFSSLEKMNDELVFWINERVAQDDILIHLGDWSFGGFDSIKQFRDRIICKNVHLVLGNHDHHIQRNKDNVQSLFSSVHDYLHLDVCWWVKEWKVAKKERQHFICMHYPIASWNGMNDGVIHLHGHVHLPNHLRVSDGKAMDVGVDGNEMEPISLENILTIMRNQPVAKLALPKDHHEKRLV
jgi:calcineurin-like phosphoesterase family protein